VVARLEAGAPETLARDVLDKLGHQFADLEAFNAAPLV
jgi:hypothetical protein